MRVWCDGSGFASSMRVGYSLMRISEKAYQAWCAKPPPPTLALCRAGQGTDISHQNATNSTRLFFA